MLNFFLRMKLKVVLMSSMLGMCVFIFIGCIETFNWLVNPKPGNQRLISDILEEDLKKGTAKFEHPILIWWNEFSSTSGMKTCPGENKDYQCYFTSHREYKKHPNTRGIFFYGTQVNPTDLPVPRLDHEDWALIHEESPKNNPLISQSGMIRMFNHTATFRSESDLPLTFQYLESIDVITDETFVMPIDAKNRLIDEEHLGLVAYVQSSCDTPSGRDDFVRELMNHIKVDSYGNCLHNKDLPNYLRDPQKMKDVDFLHILAKYKFVLAIENAVCQDYITEKLWKVLQIGSVPIHYGAPNVREWLPNELSAVHVDDFANAKELANHLKHLHATPDEYLALLQHKPIFNSNPQSLITNDKLIQAMKLRSWGVTDQAQMSRGNFVQHFECLVCSRIARNMEMTKLGFGKMPYDADEDHYGCPAPTLETGGTLSNDKNRWWERQWNQAFYESQVLEEFMLDNNHNFTSEEFFERVIEVINADNLEIFNSKKS